MSKTKKNHKHIQKFLAPYLPNPKPQSNREMVECVVPPLLFTYSAMYDIERPVIFFLIRIYYVGASSGKFFSKAFLNKQFYKYW